jgi:general stress protein 26
MPKTITKTKLSKTKTIKKKATINLNLDLQNEITRLVEIHGLSRSVFEEFACFVINND